MVNAGRRQLLWGSTLYALVICTAATFLLLHSASFDYKNNNDHFKRYIKSHKINYGRKYKLKSDKFFNSGFVIYSKNHRILFDETKIPFEIIAKDKMFPRIFKKENKYKNTNIINKKIIVMYKNNKILLQLSYRNYS